MNLDNLSIEEEIEYLQDWYVLFKSSHQKTIEGFAMETFNPKEVNKDTHRFWLDKRGLMILLLGKKKTPIEQVFFFFFTL